MTRLTPAGFLMMPVGDCTTVRSLSTSNGHSLWPSTAIVSLSVALPNGGRGDVG